MCVLLVLFVKMMSTVVLICSFGTFIISSFQFGLSTKHWPSVSTPDPYMNVKLCLRDDPWWSFHLVELWRSSLLSVADHCHSMYVGTRTKVHNQHFLTPQQYFHLITCILSLQRVCISTYAIVLTTLLYGRTASDFEDYCGAPWSNCIRTYYVSREVEDINRGHQLLMQSSYLITRETIGFVISGRWQFRDMVKKMADDTSCDMWWYYD